MSGKQNKIKNLHLEIEIRNKLVGHLLKAIAENKIQLPDHVIKVTEMLYPKKGN